MAGQPIGTLPVNITGDWSDLQDAINEAVSAAQAGGQQIASAFASIPTTDAEQGIQQIGQAATDAGQQLSLFSDSATSLSDSVNDISSGAQQASDGLGAIGDAASSAADGITSLDSNASGAQSSVADLGDAASQASDLVTDAVGALGDFNDIAVDVDDAAATAAGGISDIGDAASAAGDDAAAATGEINDFTDAEEAAGEQGENAGSGIGVFRASLLELAEGLAVTEGIKDLGEEALTAYSSIQTATVALTSMTGSAQTASGMIEEMEQSVLQMPVALDSMVSAAQRMTAFGLSTEQVKMALQDAADAAAATGNNFDTVAQRITVMAASGTAGARQLATLGLSAQDLATAMNTLIAGSDATAATITKDFKAIGDQTAQLEVLDYALQKFGGDSLAQANTVAGAWQILKNKWDETLEVVGEDLAPLAQSFLGFASTAADAVRDAVQAFDQLPAPLKDVAEIAAIALGTAGPLLTGLAALSLAVMGIQSIPEVFAKITSAIGLTGTTATVATPEITAFAGAETAAGLAGTESAAQVALFTAAEKAAGEAAIGAGEGAGAAATGGFTSLGEELTTLITGMSGAAIGAVALGVVLTGAVWYEAKQDLDNVTASMDAMQAAMARGGGATQQQAAQIASLTTQINNYNAAAAKSAQIPFPQFDPATESITQYIAALQKAAAGTGTFSSNSALAKQQLQELQSGGVIDLTAGMATLGQGTEAGAKAMSDIAAATAKHQAAIQADKEAIQGFTSELNQATAGSQAAITAQQNLSAAQVKLTTDTKALGTELDGAKTKTESYKQAMKDMAIDGPPTLSAAVDTAIAKINSDLNANEGALQVAQAAYISLADSGTASAAQLDAAAQKVTADANKIGMSAQETAQTWQQSFGKMNDSTDEWIQDMEADAATFGVNSKQVQADMDQLAFVFGGDTAAMDAAINKVVGDSAGLVTALVNGKTVLVQQGQAAQDAATQLNAVGTASTGAGQATTFLSQVNVNGNTLWVETRGVLSSTASAVDTLGQASTGAYTKIAAGQVTTQQATGAYQGFADAALTAAQKQQQLAEQTGTANGAIIGFNGTVTSASQALQGLTNAGMYPAQTAYQQLETQIGNLAQEYADTGNPAILAQTQLLQQESDAADQLVDSLDDVSDAQGKLGSGKGGASSQVEQELIDAMPGAAEIGMLDFAPALSGGTGATSDPSGSMGGGGVDVNVPGGQAYQNTLGQAVQTFQQALQSAGGSMSATTSAVQALEHALTGGSLKPSLDLTTGSVQTLDAQFQTANSSTTTLGASVATLTKQLVAPVATFASMGDPLNQAQIALLAAGQTLDSTMTLTGQQMVAVTADVGAYNSNLATYSAAQASYQEALGQINTATAILSNTAGATTTNLGTASSATTDLGNAIVTLAGVQNSTATDAATLGTDITNLGTQLGTASSDGYQYADALAKLQQAGLGATQQAAALTDNLNSTNDAATASQESMGELADELTSVQQGGTAAQGAAEYLTTAFGDDTSGLTGALNSNALITGTASDATGTLTQSVDALASAATSAAQSISSASTDLYNKAYQSGISAGLTPTQAQASATSASGSLASGAAGTLGTVSTSAGTVTPNTASGLPPGTYATVQDAVNAGLNPNELTGSAATGYSQLGYVSGLTNIGGATTAASNAATAAGTLAPGTYATFQDAVNAGLNPNEIIGNASSGYHQEAYEASTPAVSGSAANQAQLTADEALTGNVVGVDAAQAAATAGQTASANDLAQIDMGQAEAAQQAAIIAQGTSPQEQAELQALGPITALPGYLTPQSQITDVQAAPYVASGSTGTSGGTITPITINISGMTPGASQYVANQMVTSLRNAGMKIT